MCAVRCLQGPDAAHETFSRLPSLVNSTSLQSLPAQEEQKPDASSAARAHIANIDTPALVTGDHQTQHASGTDTTSNGDAQRADSPVQETLAR